MSYRRDDESDRLPKALVNKIGAFLFGQGNFSDLQFLLMRTDVKTSGMYKTLTSLNIILDYYRSRGAGIVLSVMERGNIATSRGSRKEGVVVMVGKLPGETAIDIGGEDSRLMEDA